MLWRGASPAYGDARYSKQQSTKSDVLQVRPAGVVLGLGVILQGRRVETWGQAVCSEDLLGCMAGNRSCSAIQSGRMASPRTKNKTKQKKP